MKEFHHIIDPRTGYSAIELISVTVVAGTALEADAIATSVFVSGVSRGMELVKGLEGVEALIITSGGKILISEGKTIFYYLWSDKPLSGGVS